MNQYVKMYEPWFLNIKTTDSWEVGQNRVQYWKNKTLYSDKWNYIYVS